MRNIREELLDEALDKIDELTDERDALHEALEATRAELKRTDAELTNANNRARLATEFLQARPLNFPHSDPRCHRVG